MDLSLIYRALAQRQVDLIAGDATSGLIDAYDLAMLQDDRHYFPPYDAVPVARGATLLRYPEVRGGARRAGRPDHDRRHAAHEPGGRRRSGRIRPPWSGDFLAQLEREASRLRDDQRMASQNSFQTRAPADGRRTAASRSSACRRSRRPGFPGFARLPYSLKILLENLLRREDGRFVDRDDIQALAGWDVTSKAQKEIAFMPARVLLQDFTGVPAVVDLAAMRDGVVRLGGDPQQGQPAAAGRAGHRSLGAGRSLRRAQRRSS